MQVQVYPFTLLGGICHSCVLIVVEKCYLLLFVSASFKRKGICVSVLVFCFHENKVLLIKTKDLPLVVSEYFDLKQ